MKLATLAAAGLALLASTGLALAVDDTGTITKIEWSTGTITLDNGNIYVVPPYLQSQVPLKVGDKVKVTYEDMIASAITKAT